MIKEIYFNPIHPIYPVHNRTSIPYYFPAQRDAVIRLQENILHSRPQSGSQKSYPMRDVKDAKPSKCSCTLL